MPHGPLNLKRGGRGRRGHGARRKPGGKCLKTRCSTRPPNCPALAFPHACKTCPTHIDALHAHPLQRRSRAPDAARRCALNVKSPHDGSVWQCLPAPSGRITACHPFPLLNARAALPFLINYPSLVPNAPLHSSQSISSPILRLPIRNVSDSPSLWLCSGHRQPRYSFLWLFPSLIIRLIVRCWRIHPVAGSAWSECLSITHFWPPRQLDLHTLSAEISAFIPGYPARTINNLTMLSIWDSHSFLDRPRLDFVIAAMPSTWLLEFYPSDPFYIPRHHFEFIQSLLCVNTPSIALFPWFPAGSACDMQDIIHYAYQSS